MTDTTLVCSRARRNSARLDIMAILRHIRTLRVLHAETMSKQLIVLSRSNYAEFVLQCCRVPRSVETQRDTDDSVLRLYKVQP